MATTFRIPRLTVEGATVGEPLDTLKAPHHPIDELRAARRELLAALQSRTSSDLLRPGMEGEPCGRDVLLHMAAWLHELAHLVPDLATYGYQRGEPCDPGPDWAAWNAVQIAPHREVRPEAAVARVVTAHARLLTVLEGLDEAGLRRRGPTRFGFETSGCDLLLAEAAYEREYAARLMARPRQPTRGDANRDGACLSVGVALVIAPAVIVALHREARALPRTHQHAPDVGPTSDARVPLVSSKESPPSLSGVSMSSKRALTNT
jgi:hypothetical protein